MDGLENPWKSPKNDDLGGTPSQETSISTCSFSAKIYLENLRRHHPLLALLKGTNHCVEAAQLRPLISRRDAIDTIGTANQKTMDTVFPDVDILEFHVFCFFKQMIYK